MQQQPKLILRAKGFRMWKSGKRWVFGIGAMTAIFLSGSMQALAQEVPIELPISNELRNESSGEQQLSELDLREADNVTSRDEASDPSALAFLDQAQEVTAKDTQTQQGVDVTTAKPVHIYYKPSAGDSGDYYAYIWGDGLNQEQHQKDLKMTKEGDQWKVTITPKKEATFFNYIIKKGTDWNNKKTGDMTATVNPYTETNIYVGDDFYSQISNLQTEAFDKTFGYEDKVVDASAPDKFKTIGSLGRLGATLNEDGTATINLWAPTAKGVKLNLYKDLTPGSTVSKTVDMTRGTDVNPDDHTKNTVGVWHYKITKEILDSLQLQTAKNLAYDYTLSLPNAHFIQVEEQHVELDGQKKVLKVYRNSATEKVLNYHHQDASKTVLGQNREATREEVAAFYAGDNFERKQEHNESKVVVKEHNHREVTTQDPYSVAVIQGGTRSVILDPSKVGEKVTVTKNKRAKTNSEISVLEVNIRDFSIDPSSGVAEKDRGNYLGFVQTGTKTPDGTTMTGLDYLKYRGTNYLQMMPLNDFETVPELDKDDPKNIEISKKENDGVHENQQNWGYDPKNYNVPEGSYATDPKDPENRIKELKEMMQKLHDAGLNVTLDVVYNHLYHGQKNVFEQTVPGYYYAINQPANIMNNDIFVGNAVRSNSEMMRRYIVNSTVFWAAEYGMDGFRFDAMSDLDVKTLNDIREALNKVGDNIMTYGEGWDSMGKYLPAGEAGSDVQGKKIPTYGFFDATSRNAIVGHAHDHHLDDPGFVNQAKDEAKDKTRDRNPNIDKASQVAQSLLGGNRDKYANASQQLNYVECHDGMTLSDLLKRYNIVDLRDEKMHLNRVELATAMSALAQGIHFSQHGQEFLRTKNNSVNTYNSGDEYNKIDWNLVKKHADAVNFSKAITQLRLAEPLFQLSEYKDIDEKMVVTNAQDGSGIITYELRPDGKGENKNGKYLIIFNNNKGDGVSSLTLGGDEWYYGGNKEMDKFHNTENNRGYINAANDFSKAFIVATNAKNLYDKIGQTVGSQKLTVDPLSATILFIPAPAKAIELKEAEREITYVDRQGKQVAEPKRQAFTYLTVEEAAPDLKFGFEKSQIPVTPTDLGNKENIVNRVSSTTPKVKRLYLATDVTGKAIKANLDLSAIKIGDDGKPQDTADVKWKLATSVALVEQAPDNVDLGENYTKDKDKWLLPIRTEIDVVAHPKVEGYQVQSISPENAGDKDKVTQSTLDPESKMSNIKVVYAKEMTAKLVSDNDPSNQLPKATETAVTQYQSTGLEGEEIHLTVSDDALKREGYTYTVNGKSSLKEALAEYSAYSSGTPVVFKVVYTKVENQESLEKEDPKPTVPESLEPIVEKSEKSPNSDEGSTSEQAKLDDESSSSTPGSDKVDNQSGTENGTSSEESKSDETVSSPSQPSTSASDSEIGDKEVTPSKDESSTVSPGQDIVPTPVVPVEPESDKGMTPSTSAPSPTLVPEIDEKQVPTSPISAPEASDKEVTPSKDESSTISPTQETVPAPVVPVEPESDKGMTPSALTPSSSSVSKVDEKQAPTSPTPSKEDELSDVKSDKETGHSGSEVPNSETKKDNTPTLKNEDDSSISTKRELVDVPTGVRVVLSEKELSEIVDLRVVPKSLPFLPTPSVLAGKDYEMYDIDLIDSRGKVVKMAYTARVSLPIATDKVVAQVLYLPQSGQVHSLDFTVQDLGQSGRFVEFTAKSFSDYAVIYHATAQNIEQTNSTSKAINDEQDSSLAVAQDSVLSVPVASAAKELPKTAAILPKTGETVSVLSLVGLALLGTVVTVLYRRKGK